MASEHARTIPAGRLAATVAATVAATKSILLGALLIAVAGAGCATIRVTDPPRTATEQFLVSVATRDAVQELTATPLRGRLIYVDGTYLSGAGATSLDQSFLLGEIRAHLLQEGVRLSHQRDQAEIVLEVRSGALGIDRTEFLLGIPALYLPSVGTATDAGDVPLATPELAIVKSTKQYGFASVAFVAYWRDTGELVHWSGPFVGRTRREDFWFFGIGPRTVGNIPPTEQ